MLSGSNSNTTPALGGSATEGYYAFPFPTPFTTPSLDFKRTYAHLLGVWEAGAGAGVDDADPASSSSTSHHFAVMMSAFNALTTTGTGFTKAPPCFPLASSAPTNGDDGTADITQPKAKAIPLSLHPFDPTLSHRQKALYYELRGRVYQAAGPAHHPQAIADYGKALLLDPALDVWITLGDLYWTAHEQLMAQHAAHGTDPTASPKVLEGTRRCLTCYTRGLTYARRSQDPVRMLQAMVKVALSSRRLGEVEESRALLDEEALVLVRAHGEHLATAHPEVLVAFHFGRGITHISLYLQHRSMYYLCQAHAAFREVERLRPADPDMLMHLAGIHAYLLDLGPALSLAGRWVLCCVRAAWWKGS
jgi:hypothetical protein